jgi:hypothetical protein
MSGNGGDDTDTLSASRQSKRSGPIALQAIQSQVLKIRVQGISPIILHAWSVKARDMMLGKQEKKAPKSKERRDPVGEFKSSLYLLPDGSGFGIPSRAFKGAMVTAGADCDMKMTQLRRVIHVAGEFVPIKAPPVKTPITEWDEKYKTEIKWEHQHGASMRMDYVRLANGVSDLRFRGQFVAWEAVVPVQYDASVLSEEQVVNLLNRAGWSCGLCEDRPSSPSCKTGEHGRFEVVGS